MVKVSYLWTIENFTFYFTNQVESHLSPKFFAPELNQVKWQLNFKTYGPTSGQEEHRNYISLYLCLVELPENRSVTAKFSFSIVDKHGKHKNKYSKCVCLLLIIVVIKLYSLSTQKLTLKLCLLLSYIL